MPDTPRETTRRNWWILIVVAVVALAAVAWWLYDRPAQIGGGIAADSVELPAQQPEQVHNP